MNYNIFVGSSFLKELKSLSKKYPSIKEDIKVMARSLQANPLQGSPLGKDCYKIRIAISSKGKGKSGGARIITCVKIVQSQIFFLSIYDKSKEESISNEKITLLLKEITRQFNSNT